MFAFKCAIAAILALLSASRVAPQDSPASIALIARGAEFAAALLDPHIILVYVNITEDLQLRDADFPSEAVVVSRNVTIEGIQKGPDEWPMVDLGDAYHKASTWGSCGAPYDRALTPLTAWVLHQP